MTINEMSTKLPTKTFAKSIALLIVLALASTACGQGDVAANQPAVASEIEEAVASSVPDSDASVGVMSKDSAGSDDPEADQVEEEQPEETDSEEEIDESEGTSSDDTGRASGLTYPNKPADAYEAGLASVYETLGRKDVAAALGELVPFPVDIPATDDAFLIDIDVKYSNLALKTEILGDESHFAIDVEALSTYSSHAEPADIASMYETRMPGLGYDTVMSSTTTQNSVDYISLQFQKNTGARDDPEGPSEVLNVTIIDDPDKEWIYVDWLLLQSFLTEPEFSSPLLSWAADVPVADGFQVTSFAANSFAFTDFDLRLEVEAMAPKNTALAVSATELGSQYPRGLFTLSSGGVSGLDGEYPTIEVDHPLVDTGEVTFYDQGGYVRHVSIMSVTLS